jgi:hypothetical protein
MALPRLADLLTDNPVHKAVGDMRKMMNDMRTDIASLNSALRTNTSYDYTPSKPSTPPAPSFEVPTEEETTIELKKRLLEELTSAEDDLVHKLKIPRKDGTMTACSCLDGKHDVKIISKAREIMPKDPTNPLYPKIIHWWESNHDKLTAKASASGQYDEEYIKMAGEQGNFRRQIQKELAGSGQGIAIQSAKEFLEGHGSG